MLDQAFLWRLVDLTESDGRPIDRVIATKFPAYCVRHPNKVAWVLHQFRQAYDYDRTELGQFSEARRRTARPDAAIERLDRIALGEARRVFATSRNVAEPAAALQRDRRRGAAAPAAVARLSQRRARRLRPLGQPARPCEAHRPADRRGEVTSPALRIVIAGEGPDRERLEQLAGGLNGQVEFAGRVDDERLADLYARCLAVYYAPVDEDFGMVPYEAFLSAQAGRDDERRRRPARGRPRPRDRPRRRAAAPPSSAAACAYLAAHVDEAKAWGAAGQAVAERVTWDACVDALLA